LMNSTTEKLKQVVDGETGKRVFDTVLRREDVLHGDYAIRAPDLFLIPNIGFEAEVSRGQFDRMTGTHRPEGIYVHYRPRSRSSVGQGPPIRPWDVAATILSLQDVSVPSYFDGNPKLATFA